MPALKQHNSSHSNKANVRQWCSSPTSDQPISIQPKLGGTKLPAFRVRVEWGKGECRRADERYI
eukprot:170076-Pelagomonas_calceolata.AAC.1